MKTVEPSFLIILIENPTHTTSTYQSINKMIENGNTNIGLIRENTNYFNSFLGLEDDMRKEKPIFKSKLYDDFYPTTLNGDYKKLYGDMPLSVISTSQTHQEICGKYKIQHTICNFEQAMQLLANIKSVEKPSALLFNIDATGNESVYQQIDKAIPNAESRGYQVIM